MSEQQQGTLCDKLGISTEAVRQKSRELLRLTNAKTRVGLGKAEICKPAVCVELACR
jgi:hypothetical protein